MTEPPRPPEAKPLVLLPKPVKAPLGICIIGAAVGWALVYLLAAPLYAAPDAHGTQSDNWAPLFIYPLIVVFGGFALLMTLLTVTFAFIRRVDPAVRTLAVLLGSTEAFIIVALVALALWLDFAGR
jgi:hypothetical protein